MKKFVIERSLPGAGQLSQDELQAMSQTSCEIVNKLGQPYHWIESFVTGDKIYCIHIAESESVVREHARLAGFPINTVAEVIVTIDPITGNPLWMHHTPDLTTIHELPEKMFIHLVAQYLARNFMQSLLTCSNKVNYTTYVGCLREILEWSIDFHARYYTLITSCKNESVIGKNKFNAATLEELIVVFGQEKLHTFYMNKTKTNHLTEKLL